MPPTHSPPLPRDLALAPPWQSSQFESAGQTAAAGTLFLGMCSTPPADTPLELYWLSGLAATAVKPQSIDRDLERLAALRHPNLVPLEQVGRSAGIPYQLRRRGEESTLADSLRGWPWPHREATELVAELTAGLAAAHEAGVGHFDLHPAQVEWSAGQPLRLGRFAIAPPRPGRQVGRGLAAVPPERWRAPDRPPELSEDTWAVGVLLYELLTGRPPFASTDAAELARRVMRTPHIPASQLVSGLPGPLVQVLECCLEKNPANRYETAAALRNDLRHALAGEVIEARRPGLLRRLGRRVAQSPVSTLGPAVAGLGLLSWGLTGWGRLGNLEPRHFELQHNKAQADQLVDRYQTGLRESMATLRRMGEVLSSEPFQYQPEARPLKEAIALELVDFHSNLLNNTGGRQTDEALSALAQLQAADLSRLRGEYDEAVEGYHQTMRILQFKRRRLSPEGPSEDPQVLEALVACNRGEGLALVSQRNWAEALGCFDAAINLADKAVEAGGGGPKLALLKALSLSDRARLNLVERRFEAARTDATAAESALARLQPTLSPGDPATSSDETGGLTDPLLVWARAETLLIRGAAHAGLNQPADARTDLTAARALLVPDGPAQPPRLDRRSLLARIDIGLAHVSEREQNPAAAQPLYRRAADSLQQLLTDHPSDVRLLEDLATCQDGLGEGDLARETRARIDRILPAPANRRPGQPPRPGSR
ncbi:MAG: protein kinase domain-containing protein [Planctomycetaceae bacterium]